MYHGSSDGNGALGANLEYSKFLFVTLQRDDTGARARVREAGVCIGRGFFNDFHVDGAPDTRSNETIQFLVASTPRPVQRRAALGRLRGAPDDQVSAPARRDPG